MIFIFVELIARVLQLQDGTSDIHSYCCYRLEEEAACDTHLGRTTGIVAVAWCKSLCLQEFVLHKRLFPFLHQYCSNFILCGMVHPGNRAFLKLQSRAECFLLLFLMCGRSINKATIIWNIMASFKTVRTRYIVKGEVNLIVLTILLVLRIVNTVVLKELHTTITETNAPGLLKQCFSLSDGAQRALASRICYCWVSKLWLRLREKMKLSSPILLEPLLTLKLWLLPSACGLLCTSFRRLLNGQSPSTTGKPQQADSWWRWQKIETCCSTRLRHLCDHSGPVSRDLSQDLSGVATVPLADANGPKWTSSDQNGPKSSIWHSSDFGQSVCHPWSNPRETARAKKWERERERKREGRGRQKGEEERRERKREGRGRMKGEEERGRGRSNSKTCKTMFSETDGIWFRREWVRAHNSVRFCPRQVTGRPQWVPISLKKFVCQNELTKFFADLSEFGAKLNELLLRKSTLETAFHPFPSHKGPWPGRHLRHPFARIIARVSSQPPR